jgi:hypothetical protein
VIEPFYGRASGRRASRYFMNVRVKWRIVIDHLTGSTIRQAVQLIYFTPDR